jgi:hypothetical protein
MEWSRASWLCTVLIAGCAVLAGQNIPQVTAESLNGKGISLPADFAGKSAIPIVGFSRAGGGQCGPFARRLSKEPSVLEGSVRLSQIAMLESAPRLVRPMIMHGMRSGVPKPEQDRFLPLVHGENRIHEGGRRSGISAPGWSGRDRALDRARTIFLRDVSRVKKHLP